MYSQDETIISNNNNFNEESTILTDESAAPQSKSGNTGKVVAAVAAGGVVGVGAVAGAVALATGALSGGEDQPEIAELNEGNALAEGANVLAQTEVEEPQVQEPEPERIVEHHHHHHHHEQPVHHAQAAAHVAANEQPVSHGIDNNPAGNAHGPVVHTANEDPEFIQNHDVEVAEIRTEVDNDGNVLHMATGTVDDHMAAFVDDGQGNIQAMAVDLNDNQEFEDNEIFDMREQGVGMNHLASNMVEDPDPQPIHVVNEDPEVQVVAVEENVDLNGQLVDVAEVKVDDDPILLVDVSQNGEVDVLVHDDNGNGSIEDPEIHDVSDSHIAMPTQDDVYDDSVGAGYSASHTEDLPDYSNDNDIAVYDV